MALKVNILFNTPKRFFNMIFKIYLGFIALAIVVKLYIIITHKTE